MCFYVHDVFPFQSWSVIYRDRSITINVMDVDYSRRNYRANKTRLDVQIFRSLFNEFRKTRVQLQVPARELCALQPFLTDRIASYRVYNNQRRVCLFVFSLSTFPLSALKRKIISAVHVQRTTLLSFSVKYIYKRWLTLEFCLIKPPPPRKKSYPRHWRQYVSCDNG